MHRTGMQAGKHCARKNGHIRACMCLHIPGQLGAYINAPDTHIYVCILTGRQKHTCMYGMCVHSGRHEFRFDASYAFFVHVEYTQTHTQTHMCMDRCCVPAHAYARACTCICAYLLTDVGIGRWRMHAGNVGTTHIHVCMCKYTNTRKHASKYTYIHTYSCIYPPCMCTCLSHSKA